jgi:hypothetical protein
MNYVETQLYIPHKAESDFDVEKQNDNEVTPF